MIVNLERFNGIWHAWVGELTSELQPLDDESDVVATAGDPCDALRDLANIIEEHPNRDFILVGDDDQH